MSRTTRWVAVVVTLAASARGGAQPAPRAARLFSDGQDRAAVATARTRVSLSPDGPWLARPAAAGAELQIHDERGPRFQIVEEVNGAKLVLYIDPATLQAAARDDLELAPSIAAAAHERERDSPGMTIEKGTPIESAAPAANGLAKVRVRAPWSSDVQITGYVPASGIGTVYGDRHGSPRLEFADITLPARFKLLDAPRGAPFVVSTGRERAPGKLIRRDGEMSLVRIGQGAVGWIATSQLAPPKSETESLSPMQFQRMYMGCDAADPFDPRAVAKCAEPKNTLPFGTLLFDAIDGRAVGVVLRYFRAPTTAKAGGWTRVEVTSRYGKLGLFAPPGAAEAAAAATAAAAAAPDKPRDDDVPALEADPADPNDPNELEGGVVAAPPPPPPPQRLPPAELAALQIHGPKTIVPNDETRAQIAAAHKDKLLGSYMICIGRGGEVTRVNQLKSTGFPDYDQAIVQRLREVRYRPYQRDGAPQEACSATTILYPPGEVRPPPP